MEILGKASLANVRSHRIDMHQTDPNHRDSLGKTAALSQDKEKSFALRMGEALDRVSHNQHKADNLFERMITHPDEVEPHDVTIAMAEAEMSLNLAKTIVDRAVKAYTDITTMR